MVGLSDRALHMPNELSGGQKQRVAIARALVTQPKVILADEPTGALDSKTTEDIMALIKEVHSLGNTIVIVTHNMQQAARVSDMTAFMYMSKLIEYDDTDTLFTNPEQKQTEDYITGRYG